MQSEEACAWLIKSHERAAMFAQLTQPMTARQLAHLHRLRPDVCSRYFSDLTTYELMRCLNSGTSPLNRVELVDQPGESVSATNKAIATHGNDRARMPAY